MNPLAWIQGSVGVGCHQSQAFSWEPVPVQLRSGSAGFQLPQVTCDVNKPCSGDDSFSSVEGHEDSENFFLIIRILLTWKGSDKNTMGLMSRKGKVLSVMTLYIHNVFPTSSLLRAFLWIRSFNYCKRCPFIAWRLGSLHLHSGSHQARSTIF